MITADHIFTWPPMRPKELINVYLENMVSFIKLSRKSVIVTGPDN